MSKKLPKILVDEQWDGLDDFLIKHGYNATSVKKLFAGKGDHGVLKYVEKHKMLLITQDKGNIKDCKDEKIPHVAVDKYGIYEMVLDKLRQF